MDKISGVYKITNKITGDFYIGSSKDIKRRWRDHRKLSQWKAHSNTRLYKDMFEFGLDNFTFEIIEETSSLKEREQYYIEQLKPSYNSIRAKGHDTERHKEGNKAWYRSHLEEHSANMKAWYEAHKDERSIKSKAWYEAHKDEHLTKCKARYHARRDECLAKSKAYDSRLCLYEGETLTLAALRKRLCKQGIVNPTLEAKKYLI